MEATAATQQPAAGNDELAKVLADIGGKQSSPADAAGLQFEETPAPGQTDQTTEVPTPAPDPAPAPEPPAADQTQAPAQAPAPSELETIKKNALEELRPLATKLNLPPEEKFDTLLLIIRSTDDQSLIQSAYEAARTIDDESKRAEALLDVIKEIDYFSGNQPKAA